MAGLVRGTATPDVSALAAHIRGGVRSGGLASKTLRVAHMRSLLVEAATLGSGLRDAVLFVTARYPMILAY